MGRIMAIDYGRKRVGLAVTDPLKIIAHGLETIRTMDVFNYLQNYLLAEEVETFVVGEARKLDNSLSESAQYIEPFVKKLQSKYPAIPIVRIDERFTSKIAKQSMIESGLKKKDRQNKALVDTISATLILQSYMCSI